MLLLEAGGSNRDLADLSAEERFKVAFKPDSPLNWGYKVEDNGREIDYSRGRGLGGSTAINFCGWVTGPSADYDEWARQVDDPAFNWLNAQRHLASIVSLHPEVPDGFGHRVRPSQGGWTRPHCFATLLMVVRAWNSWPCSSLLRQELAGKRT